MDVRAELAAVMREPTSLVGMGNPLRRDDGVGPWVAEAVRGSARGTPHLVFNVEDVLENHVHDIARADSRNVVLVDAASSKASPGSVVFGALGAFAEAEGLSTHKLALSLSAKILEAAGKDVFLLGVVPADLDFGSGLTPDVERSAAGVRDLILENFHAS